MAAQRVDTFPALCIPYFCCTILRSTNNNVISHLYWKDFVCVSHKGPYVFSSNCRPDLYCIFIYNTNHFLPIRGPGYEICPRLTCIQCDCFESPSVPVGIDPELIGVSAFPGTGPRAFSPAPCYLRRLLNPISLALSLPQAFILSQLSPALASLRHLQDILGIKVREDAQCQLIR
ncbi:hypothetical protein XENTR_v10010558 [Xenopus tropicalis]|nr:hypothetical protein XENTR_v10010558 [Xenopus tropicalis]